MNDAIERATTKVREYLRAKGLKLATAESCTGGLIAYSLCATGDTTDFFSSGFTTYTNKAKQNMLGVSEETLRLYTAVSEQTVKEMAQGARDRSGEDVSLSVSGYAGPDGGEDGTPAGTVWFGWALNDGRLVAEKRHFNGDPKTVIDQAAAFALERLIELLKEQE
ncbi:2-oxo-tetronate isomerase [Franconibacter daqui]|uniref:2-oxo-tetronate isomerase n=1 Tax=Franconibacter daqui TaxID=2047724 RepID=UPI002DBA6C2B|nr:2-oxo-tetronate isomerase [Franconibacter daqui]MEB5921613.1 2-oxo-tetronate isomerase [Franconibacter daqui]